MGESSSTITVFFFFFSTDADDYYLDIDNLFCDMPATDTSANGSFSNTPYVILILLFVIMLQTLLLSIWLDLLFAYSLFS